MECIYRGFSSKILSISQRQPLIMVIEKKDGVNRNIKNWRPILLSNVDTKILSKFVSNKLEAVLPTLIFSQQTAYVKNRFIAESGRLISDIIIISDWYNIKGFLVTMDIEKAFDSLGYDFFSVWRTFGLSKIFYHLEWNFIKR